MLIAESGLLIMSTMKVNKLLHTRMRVSDMDQTIQFYTERSWS